MAASGEAQEPTGHHNHHQNGLNGLNGANGHNEASGENPQTSVPQAPIAVVGMACRFAGGVTSPAELWDLCREGRDCWSPIPKDRFDVKSLYHADKDRPGRQHAVGGYFMEEDVARFDAGFFNFPADVANIRLLLEVVYEATEDSGIPIESLAGTNTSVFSGCYGKDYHDLQTRDPEAMPPSFLTGNYTAMMSNRISHYYNLQGASMSIDTGCSAGIACLHQGCLSIRAGESDVSIVGASSTMLNPDLFLAMSSLGMVGADGRCYAWDERAQGYGRGEGVAALVLKGLDAALRDGDRIHAVIRDTGLNQDGKTQSITSPSIDAQARLIRDCYRRAGLNPTDTGYVEAHMTGTQAGDVAEATALAQTFGAARPENDPVLVGSVKTNIGHTEGVSGLAAIIKAAFAMKHGQVPRNLNYARGNPKIPLHQWRLRVPTTTTAWPRNKPLRASINNFGYGGTNSHVILDAAPVPPTREGATGGDEDEDTASRVFLVSAKDAAATRAMAKGLAVELRRRAEQGRAPAMADLAHTLSTRRSRFEHVATARARTLAQLADALASPALRVTHAVARAVRLGFVFNGQGAQWHAMGRELLPAYPVFASAVREADDVLRSFGAAWSLQDELLRDAKTTRVSLIHLSQPVTVALQLCLVRLLSSWGAYPEAVVSHSSGEIAAAFAAGALSFRQALGVVYYRGELARKYQALSPVRGAMAAAGLGADDAARYLGGTAAGGRVVVACVNSPESVTLSGDADDLDEIVARLERDGIFARRLKVGLAYHSHHMLPMEAEYIETLRRILPAKCSWDRRVLYASPVTGGVVDWSDGLAPEHWAANLTQPVLFSGAFDALADRVDAVVEIGPHSTLAGPIRQILGGRKMAYTSCLKRGVDAVDTMQDLACDLVHLGLSAPLHGANAAPAPRRPVFVADLPTYAWNHTTRYWVESRVNRDIRQRRFPPHELLGLLVAGGTPLAAEWRNFLRLADVPWLSDHQVDSQVVLPGAAYISMAVEAAKLLAGEKGTRPEGYHIRDTEFLGALTIPDSSAVEVRMLMQPIRGTGWYEFQVCSMGGSSAWVENCRGQVSAVEAPDTSQAPQMESFLGVGAPCREIDVPALVSRIGEMSIVYGPAFQNLTRGQAAADRAILDLRISDVPTDPHTYTIHPTTLDCIVQATYSALPKNTSKNFIVLPRSVSNLYIPRHMNKHAGEGLQVYTILGTPQTKGFTSSVEVANAGKNVTNSPLRMENLFLQAIPRGVDVGPGGTKGEVTRSKARWQPDVQHRVPGDVLQSLRITLTDEDVALERKKKRASYFFIADAAVKLDGESQDGWPVERKKMFEWMRATVLQGQKGQLGPGSRMWSRATKGMKQALYDELGRGDAHARLLVRVGSQLADLLRGHTTLSDITRQEGLLSQYYLEAPRLKLRSYRQLAQVARLYATKNPGAKVLEIGGGTGAATSVLLGAGTSPDHDSEGSLWDRYTFTDPSGDVLDGARQKFAAWAPLMEFQKLDVEALPSGPSGDARFDLVVASMALRTTKDLHQALLNIRDMLKPGGTILLAETTQDQLDTQLIFGTLPFWWSGEEQNGNVGPCPSVRSWDESLRRAGFSSVDLAVGDCESAEFQCTSTMLSRVATPIALPSIVSIVHRDGLPQAWSARLIDAIRARSDTQVVVEQWSDVVPGEKLYIFAGDLTGSFLADLDRESFTKLQQILLCSSSFLWLSRGGLVDAQSPVHAQIQGLLRTLRHEDTNKRYAHLDFEISHDDFWAQDTVDSIMHVVQHTLNENMPAEYAEWEYAVKDGTIHVPRVYPDDGSVAPPAPHGEAFQKPGRSLVWQHSTSHFVDKGPVEAEVPDGMVEIESRAFGLPPRLHGADGETEAYDVAGIVTAMGPHTEACRLRVGDRVVGLVTGPVESRPRAPWTSMAKMPDTVPFADAAAVATAYSTASHTLRHVARLRSGEAVLIHPGAHPTSQAAVITAQSLGARVFATAGTTSERAVLVEKYGILPEHALMVQDTSIGNTLKTMTNGEGIDVVFSVSAVPPPVSLRDHLARFGRFVQAGGPSLQAHGHGDFVPSGRCATYAVLNMLEVAQYSGALFHEALTGGMQTWNDTRHQSPPLWPVVQYPVLQMSEALQHQGGAEIDATLVVIHAQPNDSVMVVSQPKTVPLDDADTTFLIVGGLGGLGKHVASRLMDEGAKNLLVVSRNAEAHAGAAALREKAVQQACHLQIRNCDVTSADSVSGLLKHACESMPPIRGVVDAAMVLEDSVFERMNFDQWRRAVRPKVMGAVNLGECLPPDLSFFILLSSVTGVVGHSSQANYAAGNTFQDAFARHRVANGRPTVSIDLSAVVGAGAVAEDGAARRRVEALGTVSIEVDAVVDVIIDTITKGSVVADDAQVIVNLESWSKLGPDAHVRHDRRFGTLRLGLPRAEGFAADAGLDAQTLSPSAMLAQALAQAKAKGEAKETEEAMARALGTRLAGIFNLEADGFDLGLPLGVHGVDSLVAVELRNWLATVAKVKISIFEILQAASVYEIANLVLSRAGTP